MMPGYGTGTDDVEKKYIEEKCRQPGVAFPSARKQEHILIVRLDLAPSPTCENVRNGLRTLCSIFERIDKSQLKIEEISDNDDIVLSPLSKFFFTATLGFGIGFFNKLNLPRASIPEDLYEMPDNFYLGDPRPYSLKQTDLILQLCSSKDYVNRWILEYSNDLPHLYGKDFTTESSEYQDGHDKAEANDVLSAINGWATVMDVHTGFQRIDGRNLMGFHDGISNPNRLQNDVIWTTKDDEIEKLEGGTYMVFQKIEHDLAQWSHMDETRQEEWIGRSKQTGLFLGTLSKEEDTKLATDTHSEDASLRARARTRLKELLKDQKDPEKMIFDDPKYDQIQIECPVWSHVRKANPREANGTPKRLIYRRGYLFSEASQNGKFSSGLLFICFQRRVKDGFEFIKKELLNNNRFPVPEQRKNFTRQELERRHYKARFSAVELRQLTPGERALLGIYEEASFAEALRDAEKENAQNSGKEGLCGPSEDGVFPEGQFSATVTLGGGYYFVPPIPHRSIKDIGQQFF